MLDTLLPFLMIAFDSAKHYSTRHTPASVYLNRELLQILWDIESDPSAQDREQKMKEVVWNLLKSQNKTKNQYDKGRSAYGFVIGDKVLYKTHKYKAIKLKEFARN